MWLSGPLTPQHTPIRKRNMNTLTTTESRHVEQLLLLSLVYQMLVSKTSYDHFQTRKSLKKNMETSMNTRHKCCSKVLEALSKWGPKWTKYQSKSNSRPQGVLSAAPMASQGAPKVPGWSHKVPKWGTRPVKRQFLASKVAAPAPQITVI